jgi:hypothetical protein
MLHTYMMMHWMILHPIGIKIQRTKHRKNVMNFLIIRLIIDTDDDGICNGSPDII